MAFDQTGATVFPPLRGIPRCALDAPSLRADGAMAPLPRRWRTAGQTTASGEKRPVEQPVDSATVRKLAAQDARRRDIESKRQADAKTDGAVRIVDVFHAASHLDVIARIPKAAVPRLSPPARELMQMRYGAVESAVGPLGSGMAGSADTSAFED